MERPKILIVDDDEMFISSIKLNYSQSYEIFGALNQNQALDFLEDHRFAAVILDISLKGSESGIDLISKVKEKDDSVPIIMLTASTNYKDAISCLKLGASEYLTKSMDIDELDLILQRAVKEYELKRRVLSLTEELSYHTKFDDFVFQDEKMQYIMKQIQSLANNDSTVLITGETGTGKEVVARTIHKLSERKDGPFIAVNCSGISDTLFESEMFGHKKGAFTGAIKDTIGKIEFAHKGTLFLDEISTMPFSTQGSLLRVIENKEITPVGSATSKKVDIRIIASTNKNLRDLIDKDLFREDLYFRLNVIPIYIPPLRERTKDIPPLINHFLVKYCLNVKKEFFRLHPEVVDIFLSYSWPGNVRELENIIERLVVLHSNGDTILPDELPLEFFVDQEEEEPRSNLDNFSLNKAKKELEKDLIEVILKRVGWRKSAAAKILGIHRNWLIKCCKKYGIQEPEIDSIFSSDNTG